MRKLVADLRFFEMSTDDGIHGKDGDMWIMEGVTNGRYHVVARWSATEYNPRKRGLKTFNSLCKFLINRSTLSDRPRNKGHKLN
jgi:hypothetical protein